MSGPAPFAPAPWDAAAALVFAEATPPPRLELPIALRRRRGYAPRMLDPRASLSLVDDDGLLRWVYEPPPAQALRGRAQRGGLVSNLFDPLRRYDVEDIGPNRVTQALRALDETLTPHQGLRRWNGTHFEPAVGLALDQGIRVLLLLHGTFGRSETWVDQFNATPQGKALWARWAGGEPYREILAFDHPTLSVAPWINALDLAEALDGVLGPFDILAHSRGGLVASWLMRLGGATIRTAVLAGSPLGGTSLASPYRLRLALDLLANVTNAIAIGGAAASLVNPMAAGVAGLAKVLGGTLKLGSQLPLADVAIGIVPGLASQQRTTDNAELERLFRVPWPGAARVAAVSSDFEPDAQQPDWRFWPRLKNLALRAAGAGADAIFPGANDLVVDTESMTQGGALPIADALKLDRSKGVHHTRYFQNPEVLGFIGQRLA